MDIRLFNPQTDLDAILGLWNESVQAGEVLYRPLTKDYFHAKFLANPSHNPGLNLVALAQGQVVGYISGINKTEFLPKETHENTPGYLTVLFVDKAYRRQGIGTTLLAKLYEAMRHSGKQSIVCTDTNPIQLDWVVPDTDGCEHNKAPGVDEGCPGYQFLLNRGFAAPYHEVAMFLDLKDYQRPPVVGEIQEKLLGEGIHTGNYDPKWGYDFDRMCDGVGSEYWRKVLQDETASPNPRPILAAWKDGHIVGFTGPVDRQENGRGWFTGICTDPNFEKMGIATVLFNLLMEAFIQVGAGYSTLFTGVENHAQRLYLRTGFRVARQFAVMKKQL